MGSSWHPSDVDMACGRWACGGMGVAEHLHTDECGFYDAMHACDGMESTHRACTGDLQNPLRCSFCIQMAGLQLLALERVRELLAVLCQLAVKVLPCAKLPQCGLKVRV